MLAERTTLRGRAFQSSPPDPRKTKSACAAHGDCVDIAPAVFELDDVAVVAGEGPAELILETARACPSSAISVIDADSGECVYP